MPFAAAIFRHYATPLRCFAYAITIIFDAIFALFSCLRQIIFAIFRFFRRHRAMTMPPLPPCFYATTLLLIRHCRHFADCHPPFDVFDIYFSRCRFRC